MEYDIELTVNGLPYEAKASADTTLLQLLRGHLHLTGTKEGCGIGECGACSVLLDGKLVNSCMVLAVEANGAEIETVEGQSDGDHLSELQEAFIKHHALQCGFCTPGMLMATDDLLRRNPSPSEEQIVEAVSGVFCRCTGYETIIEAVKDVASSSKEGK